MRKGMLRQVRESGHEVQRAAKGAAKQLESDIVEHGKQWATIRRLAHRWLRRLREGRALRGSGSCRRSGWRAAGCGRVCCWRMRRGASPVL